MRMLPLRAVVLSVIMAGLGIPSAQGREQPGAAERTPILVLQEMTHKVKPAGAWSLNALNPTFVLYEDGLVIFKKGKDSLEFFSAQLTPEQMSALLEGWSSEEFLRLSEELYSTNNQLEQPVSLIRYWQDHAMKTVRVSGAIRDSAEDRRKVPPAFLMIFDRLTAFCPEPARPWEPELLELHVIPYTNAKGEPVRWPTEWPDITDETTQDKTAYFGRGETYHIYLDGDQRDALERLLAGLNEKQAVLMHERQWHVSPFRYCLPSEARWKE